MKFFEKYFGIEAHHDGEVAVCCPFPHTDQNGETYKETRPSAHFNTDKRVFHCKACDMSASEAKFLSRLEGISYKDAHRMLDQIDKAADQTWDNEVENLYTSSRAIALIKELGFSQEAVDELEIGYTGQGISFPVKVYGELLDVRTYDPEGQPKVQGQAGSTALILPYDVWVDDDRPTLLCAGEKDMAIARSKGFNAITSTGGEMSFPKLFKASFKDKRVYIIYDNDAAGKEGAQRAAMELKKAGAYPHIVTAHYSVCTAKGEDLWDYFMKYGMNANNLQSMLDLTPEFDEKDYADTKERLFPTVPLSEAYNVERYNREIRSHVGTIVMYDEVFVIPDYVVFEKSQHATPADKDRMERGEEREWFLDESKLVDVLQMMDGKVTEMSMMKHLKGLVGISDKETNVHTHIKSRVTIYKATVADNLNSASNLDGLDGTSTATELLVYSLGHRLTAGKKYTITFRAIPHPTLGNRITGIITKVEKTEEDVDTFTVTDVTKDHMRKFQARPGDLEEKLDELYERSKDLIGPEARKDIVFTTDMFFHTPLQFMFGERVERGYLDMMIVGDPRTSKSQTAKSLLKTYGLGTIASLKSTTTTALIGGSDATGSGGYKTKVGLIPRSHKEALVMEEFSEGGPDMIGALTEMRSSNRVRIGRVSGSIDVPAMVRMLSISNPAKGAGKRNKTLREYPNGMEVVLELVGAAEDIARYDLFILAASDEHGYISPLTPYDLKAYPTEAYRTRIKWVWSRKKEHVQLDPHLMDYIIRTAESLNQTYDSTIKLFGPEAWKKLARMAIACACMVCSTDATYENVVVTEEHVNWAAKFYAAAYDNEVFRLKEYVNNERSYIEVDVLGTKMVESVFKQSETLVNQLMNTTEASKSQLMMVSGLESDKFNKQISKLVGSKMIALKGDKLVPTIKFRKTIREIDFSQLEVYPKEVGVLGS